MNRSTWHIWVDVGGTFTDCIGVAPDGRVGRVKILSTSALRAQVVAHSADDRLTIDSRWSFDSAPLRGLALRRIGDTHRLARVSDYSADDRTIRLDRPLDRRLQPGEWFELISDEEAPLLAARLLTGTEAGRPLGAALMRLATTLGTNALLERRGVRTALFTTRGFSDLLRIGTQQRPDLFTLQIHKPRPLYESVVEVAERIDARGRVLVPLEPAAVEAQARALVASGVQTAAIALLNAYRESAHERLLQATLLDCGFRHVSCSADLAPRIKLLTRAQTAVVDAYLSPVVGTYLQRVGACVSRNGLLVMTSTGGLSSPDRFRPKDSLLSGPAGGVVGAAEAGRRVGCDHLISFDMGGTSTDVARIDNDYEYRYEQRIGDAELIAPGLAIETVAAGGGSICWLDGRRLRVGPQSAGADPGPACYGAGGPLTLTDVNLLLERLDSTGFGIPVDPEASHRRLDELLGQLRTRTAETADRSAVLHGLLAIANETMADAIRRISLRRGYDPTDYALVAFGGAGGQHACGVADRLGMTHVLVPPDAALLSAVGLGHAVLERFAERQVLEPLGQTEPQLARWTDELATEARRDLLAAGADANEIEVRRRLLHLRLLGQDSTVEVEWQIGCDPKQAFQQAYAELYGQRPEEDRPIELESIRVVVSSSIRSVRTTGRPVSDPIEPVDLPLRTDFRRSELTPGQRLRGPALVVEPHSTTVVEKDWTATVLPDRTLSLSRSVSPSDRDERQRPASIRLELFTQRFTNLVREMGERLERTAVSTNVRERLDFSCALLDPRGSLVVNAPHIPVHLGALGLCVRRLTAALPLRPGDVAVTNHPAFGGSHLPDVTVITPVFEDDSGRRLLGYLASRAHHAEIGGTRPGSMPPRATCLAEEGVVIPPTRLIERGRPRWDHIRRLLLGARFPTRNVEDNLADLRAAVAANHAGARSLQGMARAHGADTIRRYMEQLDRMADNRIRDALRDRGDGVYRARELLDDGSALAVRIDCRDGSVHLDFDGSSAVHPGNLNATPAIVRSAVLYVLRLLLDSPLPLNEGLLRAATIEVPTGLLNPPFTDDPLTSPAVVGGNVETSQRLVDTLIKAFDLAACSQGTMNNLIFGNDRFGYYETIGGGCGAGNGFDGASAVHSHMTNTRITDPEILEHRYPVRLERFAIRPDSGGAGRYRGGDGILREIVFLENVELSVLTQHRTVAPYGSHGGRAGLTGNQRVIRASGEIVELRSIDGCKVLSGDRLIIETPGGGGWGEPTT